MQLHYLVLSAAPQSGRSLSLSGSSRRSAGAEALSISEAKYRRSRSRDRRRREINSRTKNPEPNPIMRQTKANSMGSTNVRQACDDPYSESVCRSARCCVNRRTRVYLANMLNIDPYSGGMLAFCATSTLRLTASARGVAGLADDLVPHVLEQVYGEDRVVRVPAYLQRPSENASNVDSMQ